MTWFEGVVCFWWNWKKFSYIWASVEKTIQKSDLSLHTALFKLFLVLLWSYVSLFLLHRTENIITARNVLPARSNSTKPLLFMQALLFTVAIIVQSGNQTDYDSDDEYIGARSGIRQPLVNQQAAAAADPRVPNLDYRPIRNDAWSQRMREKVRRPSRALVIS